MQEWLLDPMLAEVRGLLDTEPNRAWLAAQKLRDEYGWQDPELGALEHEAYMRRAFDKFPLSTGLIGLPQTFGYSTAKLAAQNPWANPLLLLATPGLREATRGLREASPASWDQFGAGISGYVGGLLDFLGD